VTDAAAAGHVAPRVAIFDLDGTLVDSLPTVAAAMAVAMERHGFPIDAAAVIPRIGPPMNLLVEEMTGCPREVADRINDDFMALYYGEYVQRTPPMAGAEALLDRMRAAGVRLSVLTNKVESGGHQMVDFQGWTARFESVAGRDSGGRPKPAPDGALLLLERLGARPDEAAIVGDTEFDMGCGRNAGLRWVVGLVGERSEAQLRAGGATHVVHALDEVGTVLLDGVEAPA
jgi:phosphoglycolate phosphatase